MPGTWKKAKSDARDARVIADQLRLRWGALQEIRPRDETTTEMRVLVAHRRDLLQDQTRRAARLREVLLGVFPGLEAALDLKREGALVAVTRVATPSAARKLGAARLLRWLKARGVRKAEELAERIIGVARAQRRELPAAEAKAALVAEIASEILRTRERIAELDRRLEEILAEKTPRRGSCGPCLGWVSSSRPSSSRRSATWVDSPRPTLWPPLRASLLCSEPRARRATDEGREAATRSSNGSCTARPSVASPTTSAVKPSTGRSEPRARATTRR